MTRTPEGLETPSYATQGSNPTLTLTLTVRHTGLERQASIHETSLLLTRVSLALDRYRVARQGEGYEVREHAVT